MALSRRHVILASLLPLCGWGLWVGPAQAKGGGDRKDSDDRDDRDDKRDRDAEDDSADRDDSGRDDSGRDDSGGQGRGRGRGGSGDAGQAPTRLPPQSAGAQRRARNGSRETLQDGLYLRHDAQGRLIERRKATAADRARLLSHDRNTVQTIEIKTNRVTVIDSAGWKEEFGLDRYRLFDPRGNLVTRRPLTRADTARLREVLR